MNTRLVITSNGRKEPVKQKFEVLTKYISSYTSNVTLWSESPFSDFGDTLLDFVHLLLTSLKGQ